MYRLTLIKGSGGNMGDDQLDAYASLIARGRPELIEVKGVTWSGVSEGSNLTMANVPWHTEVRAFCEELAHRLRALPMGERGSFSYGLASEHAHSCCVLLAQSKYQREGVWHTHIDYARFHSLVQRYYETGEAFSSGDFCAPTPPWAVFGAVEEGFDPAEARWRRNKDGSGVSAVDYVASESGCG